MGRRLRAMDPCRHLISSSFTGGSERPDLFALPEMDFSQYHSYNELHPAQMMARMSARFFEKYRKPFFVSEYGTDWKASAWVSGETAVSGGLLELAPPAFQADIAARLKKK